MSHHKSWPIFAALAVAVVLTTTACLASIENKPVKVTHRNSGPKYEFDDVERMRIPVRPEASGNSNNNNNNNNEVETNLHRVPLRNDNDPASEDAVSGPQLSIRRIFLVPMSRNPFESDRSEEHEGNQNPFGYPLNPFFMQPRPTHRIHMFGEDPASRSPTPEASETSPQKEGERESPSSEMPTRPMLDPVKLLMELMNHALNPNPQGQSPMGSFFNDLNKEASSAVDGNKKEQEESVDKNKAGSELDRPNVQKPPMSSNETKEDVVEIDGKKYLRKTIINRHVGENIIFMTKRLIFVPLNETDPELSTTTTTSPVGSSESQPATTTIQPPTEQSSPTTTQEPERKPEEASTTVASESPNTSASEVPSIPTSTVVPTESSPTTTTTSTTTSSAEETTPKDDTSSWSNGPSDMPERIVDLGSAERTQDGASTPKPTTEAPRV